MNSGGFDLRTLSKDKARRGRVIKFFAVTWLLGLAVWLAISLFLTSITFQWGLLAYLSPIPTFLITLGIAVALTELSRRKSLSNPHTQENTAHQ
jgi:MFS family permease